jgi:ABC-type uncharacterized transport system ATPase subunit
VINPHYPPLAQTIMDIYICMVCYIFLKMFVFNQLSEGQKRRVQLATCLVFPSHLILLDEVTAELDILTRRRLLKFMAKDCQDRNTTLVSLIYM